MTQAENATKMFGRRIQAKGFHCENRCKNASRFPDEAEPYVRFNEIGDKENGWLDTANGEWHPNEIKEEAAK